MIFEYTVNANSIEFKLGDVNHTMPKPLQYVKLSNDLSRVYVFSENNDIIFDAKYLPINGFATIQDLYDDLKQYAVRSSGGSYYLYSENYDSATFSGQTATGLNSIAMGGGGAVASGNYSFAIGSSTASGEGSIALGISSQSTGERSISFGAGTESNGAYSTSFGINSQANGDNSTAFGISSIANGEASTAFGELTTAKSYVETSLGLNNTTYIPISDTTFELTDRLFGVGNGDGSNSDALTILKNGKLGIDIDNFETTTSDAKLQVNGYINAVLNVYANHAAADADTDLKTNDFYKLTGDRTVYQKP